MTDLKKTLENLAMTNPMSFHIEKMIYRNHWDLKKYVRDKKTLNEGICDLKNVNFMQGSSPNYRDKGQRSLYLLRYGAAYTVEYRAAYEEIFRGNHIIPGSVCILSIGCGASLDKAAAFYAMQNSNDFRGKMLIYYGIDITKWDIDVFYPIQTNFINKYLNDANSHDIDDRIDIIFFPKSISEIDESELLNFADNIGDKFHNKFCIVSSNRKSQIDDEKIGKFQEKICAKFNFEVKHKIDINPNYKFGVPNSYLWDIFDRFFIPRNIINDAHYPRTLCPQISRCLDELCEERISRCPTLTTTLFNTKIFCLKRNEVA